MTGLILTAGIFMACCSVMIAIPFVWSWLEDRHERRHMRACGELLAAQVAAYLRGEWAEDDPAEEGPWDTI